MTDHDPCPGAARVATLPAWQHPTPVTCRGCRMLVRFAWWTGTAHLCGRCNDAARGDA